MERQIERSKQILWLVTWSLLLNFVLLSETMAGDKAKPHHPKFGVGLEFGHWVPTNLNNDPDLSSLKEVKNKPYVALILLKPWRYGLTLRSTLGHWKYYEEETTSPKESVEIISILVDLKYALIPDVILLPYVSYGVGWFLGYESDKKRCFQFDDKGEMGVGINIGAGFDFQITPKISLAMEFRYHYVKFNKVIVFTDNYSGPKINLALLYFF